MKNTIIKILLFSLCCNLLYTNTMLMLAIRADGSTRFAILFGFVALTYSVISSLSMYEIKSVAAITAFALIDGSAVYFEMSPHGPHFHEMVAVYFGVYTAYCILIISTIVRTGADGRKTITPEELERAQSLCRSASERADRLAKELRALKDGNSAQPSVITTEEKPATVAEEPRKTLPLQRTLALDDGLTDEERAEVFSYKKAFCKMKDPDRRRARLERCQSEKVKELLCKMYGLF